MPLKVLDTTATPEGGNRRHEIIINGVKRAYTFEPLVPLDMPDAHARKFVEIDSFHVIDDEGNRLRTLIPITRGFGEQTPKGTLLGSDECIARLDELTFEALLARCGPLAGGERMKRTDTKETLVAFLLSARAAKIQVAVPTKVAAEDIDDADDDELDGIIPRAPEGPESRVG